MYQWDVLNSKWRLQEFGLDLLLVVAMNSSAVSITVLIPWNPSHHVEGGKEKLLLSGMLPWAVTMTRRRGEATLLTVSINLLCNNPLSAGTGCCRLWYVDTYAPANQRTLSRTAFCKPANHKRTTIGWKGEWGEMWHLLHNIAGRIAVSRVAL